MSSSTKWIGAILGAALCLSSARADEIYTFVIKKAEDKQSYKWWLTDWLEKRDKMRLMDLWLALHSPSPYEFFIGGAYIGSSAEPGGQTSGTDLHAGAFASIFGLEAHRDSSYGTRYSGAFDLRIFGFQDQGTNITLQAGVRSIEIGDATSRNPLLGARATLYLSRFFGLNGLYQNYPLSTPNSSGVRVSGHRLEGGAFIDFSFLRIYGDFFSAPETLAERNGFCLGFQSYF